MSQPLMTVEWEVSKDKIGEDVFNRWVENLKDNWYLQREESLDGGEYTNPEIVIDDDSVYSSNSEDGGDCRIYAFKAAMNELALSMREIGVDKPVTVHVENIVRGNGFEPVGTHGYYADEDYNNPARNVRLTTETIWVVSATGARYFEEYVRECGDLQEAMQKIMTDACDNQTKPGIKQ